jgi:photosystem II stability/assembly factor-like uncharacterized protein
MAGGSILLRFASTTRMLLAVLLCASDYSSLFAGSRVVEIGSLPGNPEQDPILKVLIVSGFDGWAFSSHGLWRTENSGKSWISVAFPRPLVDSGPYPNSPPRLTAIGFESPSRGWVEVEHWHTGAFIKTIYRTSDAGNSWNEQPPLPGQNMVMYARQFLRDGSTGWVAGAKRPPSARRTPIDTGCIAPPDYSILEPAIFRTVDSGQHWVQQFLPELSGCPVSTIFFRNDDEGIAASGHRLFYTSDGGFVWKPSRYSPDCANQDWVDENRNDPLKVFFLDNQMGWIGSYNGAVLRTRDGGAHWCGLAMVGDQSQAGGLGDWGAVHFNTSRHGWILGIDQRVYETSDGGASWTKIVGIASAYSMSCRSSECWVISDKLYKIIEIEEH